MITEPATQQDTPRTDAEEKEITIEGSTPLPPHRKTYKKLKYVSPDFARTLERELSDLKQECLTRGIGIVAEKEFNEEVQGELLAAKAEIERLTQRIKFIEPQSGTGHFQ